MKRSFLGRGLAAAVTSVTCVATMVLGGGHAAADTTTTADGSSAMNAAPSCWAIKQQYPSSTDGSYWLQTPQLVVPKQFYCDMTTDGGGWVLVGRGRNGWSWSSAGQGSQTALRTTITGPNAFAPAALPTDVVNGLLGGTRADALPDGIRVVRSTNMAGTTSQDMRIKLSNRSDWNWTIGGGLLASDIAVNGTHYGAGNTQQWHVDNNFLSLRTDEIVQHNWSKGWSFGGGIAGTNSATSYLWTYGTENSALPFTQVFIRPKVTSVTYPAIPDTGLPSSTVRPMMASTTAPTPWGVTGVVGGGSGEFNIEVETMASVGRTMYVGGKFQYVQKGANPGPGEKITQSYLAGFDVDTGEWVSTFRPTVNGMVWALKGMPDGNLLVGGEFTTVNGAAHQGLVELAPDGTVVPGWKSSVALVSSTTTPAQVKAIDVQDGWVYLGGRFDKIYNGTTPITVGRAARVSITDGTPDGTWKPNFDGTIVDLDASSQGDRVYFVGYFNHVNGVSSPNEAAVSTAKGAPFVTGLKPWVPSAGSGKATYQQAIAEYGDYVWQGGSEHILTQYDRATYAAQHSFITRSGGDFQAIARIGDVVYASCHCGNYVYEDPTGYPSYTNPVAYARDVQNIKYIGAWDVNTGQYLTDFYIPALDTRAGSGPWALELDPNGCLWFGGDFTKGSWQGNSYQWLGGFGKVCPRDSTAPATPGAFTATRASNGVVLRWTASTDDTTAAPSYQIFRGDRVIGTTSGTSFLDPSGTLPATYWVRAVDAAGNMSATTSAVTVSAPSGTG